MLTAFDLDRSGRERRELERPDRAKCLVLRIELDGEHGDRPARRPPGPERAVAVLARRVGPSVERVTRQGGRSPLLPPSIVAA